MKEEFKQFVQSHKELVKFVNNGKMTWQKFYEMYSLYGKNNDVWKDYLNSEEVTNKKTISDIVEALKKVDVDTVQKNITTINKALALIGTLLTKDEVQDTYTPTPLYKKFED
ncbi:MAG: hypothetical protein J5970_03210 [Bacilli bacterium]|nr:hypothetical protein [Bacilli bacterium]